MFLKERCATAPNELGANARRAFEERWADGRCTRAE